MAEPIRTRRPRPIPTRHRSPVPETPLKLREYTPRAGVAVVSAAGEIDLASRDLLAAHLAPLVRDRSVRLLVCDLSAATFLACSGLSVLLDAKAGLDGRGAKLRVVTGESAVLRMLTATGQHTALDVRPVLAAAIPDGREDIDEIRPALACDDLVELRTSLARAVEQTSLLATTWGRLAGQVAALDAERLVDGRGAHWQPRETLAEMAEDLRVLQHHLATGALLAAPTVEDLGHLRTVSG